MKFFFDRNIANRLVRVLNEWSTSDDLLHQDDDDRFEKTSSDVFIIQTLSKERPRPIFLTADLNIRRKYPEERRALRDSGLIVFFFKKGFHNLPIRVQAQKAIGIWDEIVEKATQCSKPVAFSVGPNGKIEEHGLTKNL